MVASTAGNGIQRSARRASLAPLASGARGVATTGLFLLFALLFLLPQLTRAQETDTAVMPDGTRLYGDPPSQSEGWRMLQRARTLTVEGGYWFRFELKLMPRRGPTEIVNGVMAGGRNEAGPVNRVDVELEAANLGPEGERVPARDRRLLLQSGLFSQAWSFVPGVDEHPQRLEGAELLEPIADSQLAPFDLQAPYLFWPRFYYVGEIKHRSRSTHIFWMYPPEEDEALQNLVGGVKIYLDEEFLYVIRAEVYGPQQNHLKTMSLLDFKKSDGEWFVKSIDIRDEETRNKTRFKVDVAEVGIEAAEKAFLPEGLMEPLEELVATRAERL